MVASALTDSSITDLYPFDAWKDFKYDLYTSIRFAGDRSATVITQRSRRKYDHRPPPASNNKLKSGRASISEQNTRRRQIVCEPVPLTYFVQAMRLAIDQIKSVTPRPHDDQRARDPRRAAWEDRLSRSLYQIRDTIESWIRGLTNAVTTDNNSSSGQRYYCYVRCSVNRDPFAPPDLRVVDTNTSTSSSGGSGGGGGGGNESGGDDDEARYARGASYSYYYAPPPPLGVLHYGRKLLYEYVIVGSPLNPNPPVAIARIRLFA